MTQRRNNICTNEIYSRPPRETEVTEITNKTDVHHIDDSWRLDILDIQDFRAENIRSFRYVLVVIDIFSKFGWTIPLKNKNEQSLTNSLENNLKSSKRKPNLIESDDDFEFVNKAFTILLNYNKNKRHIKKTSLGAVFAERFNRAIWDLLKGPVFEWSESNWADILQ